MRLCQVCQAEIHPKHDRGRFCGSKCRTAAWVRRKEQAARAPLERILVGLPARLEELASKIRAALKGDPEG